MSLIRSQSQLSDGIPSFICRHEEPIEWADISASTRRAMEYIETRIIDLDEDRNPESILEDET